MLIEKVSVFFHIYTPFFTAFFTHSTICPIFFKITFIWHPQIFTFRTISIHTFLYTFYTLYSYINSSQGDETPSIAKVSVCS
jgi:hypothetical protein